MKTEQSFLVTMKSQHYNSSTHEFMVLLETSVWARLHVSIKQMDAKKKLSVYCKHLSNKWPMKSRMGFMSATESWSWQADPN